MIQCRNCGMELPDIAKFCPKCGKMVAPEEPLTEGRENPPAPQTSCPTPAPYLAPTPQPAYREAEVQPYQATRQETEVQPYQAAPAEPESTPSEILVFVMGIVSIALATSGLPGLILAIITRSKARAREQAIGPLTGKAKTGLTLAKIALPLSIFFIVLWIVDVIVNAITTWRTFSFLRELVQEFRRYVR